MRFPPFSQTKQKATWTLPLLSLEREHHNIREGLNEITAIVYSKLPASLPRSRGHLLLSLGITAFLGLLLLSFIIGVQPSEMHVGSSFSTYIVK